MHLLEDVFGVSAKPIESYVERQDVDTRFESGVLSDKQVIVYGSSKQGKTSLVSKQLPYEDHILVSLTPKTTVLDMYHTILAKAGVRIITGATERRSSEASLSIGSTVKAIVPFFGSGEATAKGGVKGGSATEQKFDEVPINLELPQHVAEMLQRVHSNKWVILENFHYLSEQTQKQFAFDLRAFQELGVRFVVLGVWREKNRMAQFNGDLLDRLIEVPVEPWTVADFRRVVQQGSPRLNVRMSP